MRWVPGTKFTRDQTISTSYLVSLLSVGTLPCTAHDQWHTPHPSVRLTCHLWVCLSQPHGGTWGTGNDATDWNHAAEKLGGTVLRACARWVVMVEGVGQAGRSTPEYFWGENLQGARRRAVELPLQDKLVYSPHVYVSQRHGPKTAPPGQGMRSCCV